MIDKNKFLVLWSEDDSFTKFKEIMDLRFELDKIGINIEEVKYKMKELFEDLNKRQEGFSTGNNVIKNAFELCALMLEGK